MCPPGNMVYPAHVHSMVPFQLNGRCDHSKRRPSAMLPPWCPARATAAQVASRADSRGGTPLHLVSLVLFVLPLLFCLSCLPCPSCLVLLLPLLLFLSSLALCLSSRSCLVLLTPCPSSSSSIHLSSLPLPSSSILSVLSCLVLPLSSSPSPLLPRENSVRIQRKPFDTCIESV